MDTGAEFIVGRGHSVLIDWADVPRVKKCRWTCSKTRGYISVVRKLPGSNTGQSLSHYILGLSENSEGRYICIKHKNGNRLDCRRSNLLFK